MTISVIAQKTVTEGAQLIRVRERNPETKVIEYDCKPIFTGSKRGWTMLDSFTAGAIMAVYNALNETNRPKLDTIRLPRLLDFVWSHVK